MVGARKYRWWARVNIGGGREQTSVVAGRAQVSVVDASTYRWWMRAHIGGVRVPVSVVDASTYRWWARVNIGEQISVVVARKYWW